MIEAGRNLASWPFAAATSKAQGLIF